MKSKIRYVELTAVRSYYNTNYEIIQLQPGERFVVVNETRDMVQIKVPNHKHGLLTLTTGYKMVGDEVISVIDQIGEPAAPSEGKRTAKRKPKTDTP